MENTFWDINQDCSFVKQFKKSFTFYVESGMKEVTERDIEVVIDEQGEILEAEEFNAKFFKFIFDHYLCKYHCFYLHLTHLITLFTYLMQPTQNPRPVPLAAGFKNLHWDERIKKSLHGFKS